MRRLFIITANTMGCQLLTSLRPVWALWRNVCWILHLDNAPSHTSRTLQQFLAQNQIPITPSHQILEISNHITSGTPLTLSHSQIERKISVSASSHERTAAANVYVHMYSSATLQWWLCYFLNISHLPQITPALPTFLIALCIPQTTDKVKSRAT